MTHIDKESHDKIKAKLLEKKQSLEAELAKFTEKSDKVPLDYDAKFVDLGDSEEDNAMEVAMYEENLSLERVLEKSLQNVVKALEMLEQGTYGICEICHNEIAVERLMVQPEATLCMSCKSKE